MGGDRIHGGVDGANNTNSYEVDLTTNTTEIAFESKYHAQRSTESFVYLHHSLGGSSKNLETTSLNLSHGVRGVAGDTHASSILAKIPINIEYIHYDSLTGGQEYFVNLYNLKHLNDIKLTLKNSHGADLNTLGNTGAEHTGNLNFSCVLKVEILEKVGQDETHLGNNVRNIDPKLSNLSIRGGGLGNY